MQAEATSPIVWTEEAFLKEFCISRDTLLSWIAEGLKVLRCPDQSVRITAAAVEMFTIGRQLNSPYLTVEEAASYLKTTSQAVYQLIYRGQLKKQPGTRRVLITKAEIDRYLSGRFGRT